MWKLVKPEINKQETTDNLPLYLEGKLVNDHYELAHIFNEYFINVTTNTYAENATNNPTAINNLHSTYRKAFP
jgi:hypothetical protein